MASWYADCFTAGAITCMASSGMSGPGLTTLEELAELERAIHAYIDTTSADPRPFRWIKSADAILAIVKRVASVTTGTAVRR